MPEVDAVELADRDRGWPESGWYLSESVEVLHRHTFVSRGDLKRPLRRR